MATLRLRTLQRRIVTARPVSGFPQLDESALNSTLLSLVTTGQFSAAERLRLKIISNGLFIEPRTEYASVALACLRNRRLTGASGLKLEEYLAWLNLVPDREYDSPSAPISPLNPKQSSPFTSVVHELTYRGLAPRFRSFLSSTGLVLASKGFAKNHFLSLARPLIINTPNSSSSALSALIDVESHAAKYEDLHGLPPEPIARFVRASLIQLFAERGWVWKSSDLVLRHRAYALPDIAYQVVLAGLPESRQTHKKEQILRRWEEDKGRVMHRIYR